MAVTVTATQGGTNGPGNGMSLRVLVLTGAAAKASQNGGTAAGNESGNHTGWVYPVVTTQTGARVYGAFAPWTGSADAATGSGTTIIDKIADSANGVTYATWRQTATVGTPGSTNLGINWQYSHDGPWCMAEIKQAGTLAEDGSAPAVATNTAGTAVSTTATYGSAPFTPPAGSLLVALVTCNGGSGTETMAITDDAGGLGWVELTRNTAGAGLDYTGIWAADAPSGGGSPVSANAGVAAATATGNGATTADGTGPLFAGAASGTGWVGTSNAVGSGTGDYATWTDSGTGTSATLELSTFGAQAAVPSGATVGDVLVTVRHSEDPAAQIASVTAQCYLGASSYGSPQALTKSATVHEDTITVAGLTRTDLADLRVRVTATRT